MTKKFKLPSIQLFLFEGGAAGGTAAGEGGEAAASAAASSELAIDTGTKAGKRIPGSSRRAKSGESNIVYGLQAEIANQPAEETKGQEGSDAEGKEEPKLTVEQKRQKFRELINSDEYKDFYTEEFQRSFDRRFKNAKQNEERLQQLQPILDNLLVKYNITDGDVSKLTAAVESDKGFWAERAEEAGMNTDAYIAFERMKAENRMMKANEQRNEAQRAAEAQMQKWQNEAQQVKSVYPDFDLDREFTNRDFLGLLKAGIPVQKAYEVLHMDDIKSATAKAAAQRAEKNVTQTIQAKGQRPLENGVSSQSGIVYKSKASEWTRKDRANVAARVARGENIII